MKIKIQLVPEFGKQKPDPNKMSHPRAIIGSKKTPRRDCAIDDPGFFRYMEQRHIFMKNNRFIDLFAGIGGFRLAMEKAGFDCVFSSEWDRFAAQTYEANFSDFPAGDITKIQSSEIPAYDILCAGFPCQPFSIAGVSKKNSLGRSHGFLDRTQGTLFFEIARILRDTKPSAFILENVKNLVSHEGGRTFATILNTLQNDLGYTLRYQIINADSLLPQNRARIYIVGFRSPRAAERFSFPVPGNSAPRLRDILEKKTPDRYILSDHLWKYLNDYREKHRLAGHGFGFGLADLNGKTRTLSARYYKDGSEILIPVRGRNPRRLTPRECARLMGFPENFQIVVSDTQAYKQFGNSVAVPVVREIARSLFRALESEKIKKQARIIGAGFKRQENAPETAKSSRRKKETKIA